MNQEFHCVSVYTSVKFFLKNEKALGDGVNVASRIQSLGQENTILVSGEIYDKIKNNSSFSTISLGQFRF